LLEAIHHLTDSRQNVGLMALAIQLEKHGKLYIRRTKVADGLRPIDLPLEGQKVLILIAMVVVNMDGGDALVERPEGRLNATRHMRVANIKADFQIQARVLKKRQNALGGT
jgi:hypothetical protein